MNSFLCCVLRKMTPCMPISLIDLLWHCNLNNFPLCLVHLCVFRILLIALKKGSLLIIGIYYLHLLCVHHVVLCFSFSHFTCFVPFCCPLKISELCSVPGYTESI
uniref:Uncharacterized protein n=1 Tax=Rhizophora mucronata TaxID=61149 RepID=A0A2P2PMU5_RHIMU